MLPIPIRHTEVRLDIPRLRSFLYAAQLRSISRAAMQLRMAQPALSRHIHRLEEELGVRLLVRHGRGVRPTEAGETLLRKGELLVRQLRQTRDEVIAQAGTASGHLAFAMPPGAGQTLAPELIARYRARCPNVSLQVFAALSGFIYDWLLEGRVDLALVHNPPRAKDIVSRALLVEDLYVIAPAAPRMERLPKRLRRLPRQFDLKDLGEVPLILPGRPHGLRLFVEEIAARQSIELGILEVDSLEIIKTLVEHGLGFSVMAYNAAQREVERRALRAVPIAAPDMSWTLALAMTERRPSRGALELVRLIEELVREMVGRGIWRGRLVEES